MQVNSAGLQFKRQSAGRNTAALFDKEISTSVPGGQISGRSLPPTLATAGDEHNSHEEDDAPKLRFIRVPAGYQTEQ